MPNATTKDTVPNNEQTQFKTQATVAAADHPMPPYAAYHPLPYGSATYGPGTADPNTISFQKSSDGSANRGMNFIMRVRIVYDI